MDYIEFIRNKEIIEDMDEFGTNFVISITSEKNGYIQIIDYDKINSVSKDISGDIFLVKVQGQFVTEKSVLFKIMFTEDIEIDKVSIEKLRDAIIIGDKRSDLQDFDFSIQKIVEIALRAISPGINDPNTAIHCMKIVGILLGKLADINGIYAKEIDDKKSSNVYYEIISFREELNSSFIQIIHYGQQDISVMISILKSIKFISNNASDDNKEHILDFVNYIWEKIERNDYVKYDLDILAKEKAEILSELN